MFEAILYQSDSAISLYFVAQRIGTRYRIKTISPIDSLNVLMMRMKQLFNSSTYTWWFRTKPATRQAVIYLRIRWLYLTDNNDWLQVDLHMEFDCMSRRSFPRRYFLIERRCVGGFCNAIEYNEVVKKKKEIL